MADLVGVSNSGELRYYPNNVNGGGGVPFNTYVVSGQGWNTIGAMLLADFSGDGVADLVGVSGDGDLRYYPNNVRATGMPFTNYIVTGSGWNDISRIVAEDFSGDGVADLVGVSGAGDLRYYPNNVCGGGVPFNAYVVTGSGWNTLTNIP